MRAHNHAPFTFGSPSNIFLVASLCVGLLAACGDDDEPGTTAADGSADTQQTDSGGTDVTPSTDVEDNEIDGPDADAGEPDTDTQTIEDVDVDNEPDTDQPDADEPDVADATDGSADTSDAEVDAGTPIPEDRDRRCDDGIDNDLDGDTDCADPDCATAAACIACDDPGIVRGGACVQPESDPEGSGGTYSFVRGLRIPANDGPAACCFDFDGDDEPDNAAAELLSTLISGTDFDAEFAQSIEMDDLTMIFAWGYGPAEDGFHVYLGSNDANDDGVPDDTFEQRSEGSGTFLLESRTIDDYGAFIQFNNADRETDALTAGPSLMRLAVPIYLDGSRIFLDVDIEDAMVTANLADTDTGIDTVDETFGEGSGAETYGGMQIGGVISFDYIGELLDGLASDCSCAEFEDGPVIGYGVNDGGYEFTCLQTPTGDCSGAETICANLTAACPLLPAVGALADIDQDGDGINDSLSIGLRISLAGATLTSPPFPGEE
jgi:hypothetical protein